MSDSYATIRTAILERRQVLATYGGHRRAMCPHALGTKNGHAQALFFQFGGSSSQGLGRHGWRCMRIDRLTDVTARPGEWFTTDRDTQHQSCIDTVDVAVW